MKRTVFFALVFLVLVGMLLAACSSPATTTTTSAPKATTSVPLTTVAAKTTIAPTSAIAKTTAAPPTSTSGITSLLPAAEKPQYGGVFRFASPASPTKLVTWNQSYDGRFLKACFDTLLRIDENGQLQPWLATSYKVADDLKSINMTLRKGVKFHDGTDFNAAAAKWNIELRRDSKVGDYETVTSVDVVDDSTIRINLSSFSNTIFSAFWHIGGMMSSPAAYQKYGKDEAQWNPVGTGPFKFVSYQKDVKITYTRNDNYWRGKPFLDGYETILVSDPTTLEMGLRAGLYNVAEQVTDQQKVGLEKDGYKLLRPTGYLASEDVYMPDTANKDSPFANLKVRQAMLYAADLPAIAKNIDNGYTTPIYSIAAEGSYAYVPGIKYSYDPAKAKQLLAEGGYPNGFNATFILTTKDYNTERKAWIGYLANLGINVKVNVVDMAGMYAANSTGWYNGFTDKTLGGPDWLKQINYQLGKGAVYSKSWAQPEGYRTCWIMPKKQNILQLATSILSIYSS
jgi:peptide/nickel transport system substrate-binding protein